MNPAFTQGVIARAARTLYVGGQLGSDSTGKLLDGIEAQTTQAMRNVLTVLAAAGTGPQHVVKLKDEPALSGERAAGAISVKKPGAGRVVPSTAHPMGVRRIARSSTRLANQ